MTSAMDVAPIRGRARAMVIGATGLVGSALVRQLLGGGWEVTATVRDAASAECVAEALQGARVATLVDARDGEAVGALLGEFRPQVVVSCVGVLSGSGPGAARAYGDANITAMAVTLDACARSGVRRAIVLGSGSEYAPANYPLSEKEPIGPTSLYGATKAAAFVVAKYFRADARLEICVARPFSLYGPRERRSRFVAYVITSALMGRAIEMSTGTQVRDYLYVEDLADGLVRLARHDGRLPETLNFAGPGKHSLLDVATLAVKMAGSSVPIRTGARPGNPGDRSIYLGDSRLAHEVLGWQPTHDLGSGLAKTIDWYKAHRNLWEAPT